MRFVHWDKHIHCTKVIACMHSFFMVFVGWGETKCIYQCIYVYLNNNHVYIWRDKRKKEVHTFKFLLSKCLNYLLLSCINCVPPLCKLSIFISRKYIPYNFYCLNVWISFCYLSLDQFQPSLAKVVRFRMAVPAQALFYNIVNVV